jgi:hypothetical protein
MPCVPTSRSISVVARREVGASSQRSSLRTSHGKCFLYGKGGNERCRSLGLGRPGRRKKKARRSGLSSSLHGFGRFCRARARAMTWLAAYRALRRALLTCATAEKFAEFSIHFLALGDQLFNSRDLAVYFHVHHLLSEMRTYSVEDQSSAHFSGARKRASCAMCHHRKE